jgi:hypothetical protein
MSILEMPKIKSRLPSELLRLALECMVSVSAPEGFVKLFTGKLHCLAVCLFFTHFSAPGNVVDWAYAVAGIKYSYAAHLRDTGTYGFLLPEEWIRPTGEETTALVGYLATFISKDPKVCSCSSISIIYADDMQTMR